MPDFSQPLFRVLVILFYYVDIRQNYILGVQKIIYLKLFFAWLRFNIKR